jgi:hypothetical protein
MKRDLAKLNKLWNALSKKGKDTSFYGFTRKFYPIYLEKLADDQNLLDDHFNIAPSDITPGGPDDAVVEFGSGTISYVGRVTMALEPDIVARVFLKYGLDGSESWWANVRGPRGKLYDKLFREYFEEETTKDSR